MIRYQADEDLYKYTRTRERFLQGLGQTLDTHPKWKLNELAEELDLGFYFSFGGVITFTDDYDEIIRFIPIEKIMSETDAPFVAPVPYRGQRNNPLFIKEIVKKIKQREIEHKDILIKTQLKKPISEYKAISPHVIAAKKMQEQKIPVELGNIIKYYIAETRSKKKLVRDKVKLPASKLLCPPFPFCPVGKHETKSEILSFFRM